PLWPPQSQRRSWLRRSTTRAMGPVMDMVIRPPTRDMVTRIIPTTIPITPTVTRIGVGVGAGAAVGGVVAVSGDAVSGDAVSPGAFTAAGFTAAADTANTYGRCRCWTG